MLVELAYGAEGRGVEVPDNATVIEPADPPGLPEQTDAVRVALERPLAGPSLEMCIRDSVGPAGRVAHDRGRSRSFSPQKLA